MCQELQQSLACASINEKGLAGEQCGAASAVGLWSYLLKLTSLPYQALCVAAEDQKASRGVEKWEIPHSWRCSVTQIASVSANPQLLVRFCKVSSRTGLICSLSKTVSFLSFHGDRIVTDYWQTVRGWLFFSTFPFLQNFPPELHRSHLSLVLFLDWIGQGYFHPSRFCFLSP